MNFFIIVGTISKLLNRRLDKKISSARAQQQLYTIPRQEVLFNGAGYKSANNSTSSQRRETGT